MAMFPHRKLCTVQSVLRQEVIVNNSPESRRSFLARSVGFGGVIVVGGGWLAACGSDDDDKATSTTTGATSAATTATTAATTATSAADTTAATESTDAVESTAPTESSSGTLTSVEFQLSWLDSAQFAGSYIALDKGYYAAEGLDVTLTPGGPNAPVDPPVVQGTAIAGISAADYAGRSVASGAPFKIVGVAMQKNPFVIASLTANPVKVPADLVGKKLGMATINQPVLDALGKFNGFDASKVTVVPTQYDPAPLVNGEVDCLLCWLTDLPVAMEVAGEDVTTMLLADYGYSVHSQTYIVTEDTLKNRRDDVLALLRGEIKGWQDYKADPAAAAKLTVDRFPDAGFDLEAQTLQAEKQVELMFSADTDEHGFLWFTDESVALNVSTLAELGVTVTPDVWDRSLLEEIFADGPTI
jgi:ABC-type nitrate/sulfonate/bicarbonate transport system substrate-binding protein